MSVEDAREEAKKRNMKATIMLIDTFLVFIGSGVYSAMVNSLAAKIILTQTYTGINLVLVIQPKTKIMF